MTDETPAERYARLRERFLTTLSAVPEDGWDGTTPCEDWTVRDLVQHVVDTQGQFVSMVGREMPAAPADDPASAFDHATGVVLGHLRDPEAATAPYESPIFGPTTFEAMVDGFLSFDLVVHGWDLAHAVGVDDTISDTDIAWIRTRTDQLGDLMRTSGQIGAEVEVGPDATPTEQLVAFLGRRP
ncbi:TIGR03086 family metal-binding protein [Mumia quercus]|uniref:TIGR03086 family metal-binding protein n=1 Tax=Mumia quercus TaxID=2976125 RepID=UPI0021D0A5D6|nr:TIGR03086 family metal-binding protein [Mumia quercus]